MRLEPFAMERMQSTYENLVALNVSESGVQQNALILQTDLLEEIAIVQRSGSLTQTAYALLSDLIGIARNVTSAPARPRSPSPARRRRTL